MIKEAIKNSGAPIERIKNEIPSSWMDEYDFEDIDKKIGLINKKKEQVKSMLEYIDHRDHKTLLKIIEKVQNFEEINVINRLLI